MSKPPPCLNKRAQRLFLIILLQMTNSQCQVIFRIIGLFLQIDVLRAIRRIQTEANRLDDISILTDIDLMSLVKRILVAVLPVLITICNTSLGSEVFSLLWKSALIHPLNTLALMKYYLGKRRQCVCHEILTY